MSNKKDIEQYAASILKELPNGATVITKNSKVLHILYNTGDRVWFDCDGNVVKIITHDGLNF